MRLTCNIVVAAAARAAGTPAFTQFAQVADTN